MHNERIILPLKHLWIGASIEKLQALLWTCVKHTNLEGFREASHNYTVALATYIPIRIWCTYVSMYMYSTVRVSTSGNMERAIMSHIVWMHVPRLLPTNARVSIYIHVWKLHRCCCDCISWLFKSWCRGHYVYNHYCTCNICTAITCPQLLVISVGNWPHLVLITFFTSTSE